MQGASGRGYFGIGVEGVSKSANVGALLRTAHAFGAAFCFTIGAGWDARAARQADTAETPAHVPLWRFADPAALTLPAGCALVGRVAPNTQWSISRRWPGLPTIRRLASSRGSRCG